MKNTIHTSNEKNILDQIIAGNSPLATVAKYGNLNKPVFRLTDWTIGSAIIQDDEGRISELKKFLKDSFDLENVEKLIKKLNLLEKEVEDTSIELVINDKHYADTRKKYNSIYSELMSIVVSYVKVKLAIDVADENYYNVGVVNAALDELNIKSLKSNILVNSKTLNIASSAIRSQRLEA